jgi:hypothetical protein
MLHNGVFMAGLAKISQTRNKNSHHHVKQETSKASAAGTLQAILTA